MSFRILAENLSLLLSTQQIEVYPWQRSARFDYQIVVMILRFESHSPAESVLTARWVLYGAGGDEGTDAQRVYHHRTARG